MFKFKVWGLITLKATSAADGCSDAKQLVDDGNGCPLSELLTSWLKSGHVERSFEKCLVTTNTFHPFVFACFFLHTDEKMI